MARWTITQPLPGENPDEALGRIAAELNLILAEQEQESMKVQGQGGYTATLSGDLDMQGHRIMGIPSKPSSDDEVLSQRYLKSGRVLYAEGNTFVTDKTIVHADARQGDQSVTLAQLEALLAQRLNTLIPAGIIVIWSGAIADIPSGWHLCDGTDGTEDLRNYFIPGAGDDYAVDDNGGVDTLNLAHAHSADGTLAAANESAHTHGDGTYATGAPSATTVVDNDGALSTIAVASSTHTHDVTGTSGAGSAHGHDVTGLTDSQLSSATENRPRYWSKAYIQKV